MKRTQDRAADAARHDAQARAKTINLALQGGGAHGAFTWGVLDRLLEEERIAFEGISATSAGAMNAAVLAYGLARRRPGRARRRRSPISGGASAMPRAFSPLQPTPARPADRHRTRSNFAGLPDVRHADPAALALSVQSAELQSADGACSSRRSISSDCAQRAARSSSTSPPPTCAPARSRSSSNDEIVGGRGAGLGLPAVPVPGGRDRRRGLLGRRLHGQSGDLPADLRLRHAATSSSSTSIRSSATELPTHARRDPQPHQRDQLQLLAACARCGRSAFVTRADRGRRSQ